MTILAKSPTGSGVATYGLLPLPGHNAAEDPESSHWLGVARKVAAELAVDVVARDKANQPPFAEMQKLREAGLLTLTIPRELGGKGQKRTTALAVVREIARVDASIAQVLGYHYNWQVDLWEAVNSPIKEQTLRDSAEHEWLWASTGAVLEELTIRREGKNWIVNGDKTFARG